MKALVLASGGVDSTTCLGLAVKKYGKENVIALTVAYGQKHTKEIEAARKTAEYYEVEHLYLDLEPIFRYSDCSLLKHSDREIPHESYAEQLKETDGSPVSTYVPFRNGLFLSSAASIALSKKLQCDLLRRRMRMMLPEMRIRTVAVHFTMRSMRQFIREAAVS